MNETLLIINGLRQKRSFFNGAYRGLVTKLLRVFMNDLKEKYQSIFGTQLEKSQNSRRWGR